MSLIYGDNFRNNTSLGNYSNIFRELFKSSQVIDASNLILPATTLTYNCYYGIFNGCTSLVKAPELPATILANYCYDHMFYGCASLTEAPELPATTLATYCYNYMFGYCTSLAKAPELPATTLANYCYGYMFSYCRSLTKAPELPATTLTTYCYNYMFYGCTNLNYIKALFTTNPNTIYTSNWVANVAPTGTFIMNASATWLIISNAAIPSNWAIIPKALSSGNNLGNIIYIPGKGLTQVYEKTLIYNNGFDTSVLPHDCVVVGGSVFNGEYCESINTHERYEARFATRYNNLQVRRYIEITNIINDFIPSHAIIKYTSDSNNSTSAWGTTINDDVYCVIDLGLPSGTLWGTHDIDVSSSTSQGTWYKYGKLENFYTLAYGYDNSNYTGTENPLDINFDIARKMQKYPMHIPTAQQWQELFDNCQKTIVYNYFVQFTGPNNNSIQFPIGHGYMESIIINSPTYEGTSFYLTSTPAPGYPDTFYAAVFNSTEQTITMFQRSCFMSVRGVIDIADVETYVG